PTSVYDLGHLTKEIKEPLVVSNNNSSHLENSLQKDDDYFEVRGFVKNFKDNIVKNNSKTTQQIYDEMRNTHNRTPETTLPDYNQIKSCLKKIKAKSSNIVQYSSIEQIVVNDKTLGFCSPTGLQTLAESKYYHADGTFHTKTRYMGQMIHAYFPSKDFVNDDIVWVKRMKPCAWFFMRRRRIKDYIEILLALKKEAQNYGLELNPLYVMIDFELLPRKASNMFFLQ
ncbi:unnamed protein product, partial [Brachionus calyciflorus]